MERFPYFYSDLIARIVPGAVAVALLALLGVQLPGPWADWLSTNRIASAAILPLVLVGLAWVSGALLEALTTDLVEWRFLRRFARVNDDYAWAKPRRCKAARDVERDESTLRSTDAHRELSRRAVGRILMGPGRGAPRASVQVLRSHCEARMFTSLALLLALAALLALVGALDRTLPEIRCATHPWGRISWIVAFAFFSWVAVIAADERLRTRAVELHRAIELLRPRSRRDPLRGIRAELRALGR